MSFYVKKRFLYCIYLEFGLMGDNGNYANKMQTTKFNLFVIIQAIC